MSNTFVIIYFFGFPLLIYTSVGVLRQYVPFLKNKKKNNNNSPCLLKRYICHLARLYFNLDHLHDLLYTPNKGSRDKHTYTYETLSGRQTFTD